MRFPTAFAPLFAVSVCLGALEPLNPPVPLEPAPAAVSAGAAAEALLSAEQAQSLGFPSVAVTLYRSMLAAPGADRGRLTLALAAALMDDGDVSGAGKLLDATPGGRGAAWHLRAGLVAAYQQRTDAARSELAASRFDELGPTDRGWHLFLQGMLADAANETVRATGYYQQAAAAADSDLQRARFLLAEEELRLRTGTVTVDQLEADRKNAAAYQNQKIGYGFTREYAIALNALGRRQQAIDVLRDALRDLPAQERSEADHFRLMLGLVAGASDGVGRRELFELLTTGADPDRQRIALQLLVRSSESGVARTELTGRLDRLIAATPPHPILESLLLCRAQLELGEARLGLTESGPLYESAERDARTLLERFPGSSLKAQAYAVLAGAAWEQQRYRTAADYASRAGAELAPGPTRAEFDVLVAEAWFRAGLHARDSGDVSDFTSAADAYAAALRSRPAGVRPGVLMFQRVQSEIEAADLAAAVGVLDDFARDPEFDAEDRWEAEWNLARALEVRDPAEAYQRVNRLLQGGQPESLRPELRARMAWLQARLSYDAGRPEETLKLVDALAPATRGLPPELGFDISSTGALLRAQAQFKLGRDAAAGETLQRLREQYPRSESTVYSYIVEADAYAQKDNVVEAQRLLTKLADDFPDDTTYAPYALYQAALQAERLGTDKSLKEAYKLLESLVTNPRYASSELIFPARMREGDLLREMNQFPQAQRLYESLVNNPAFNNPNFAQDPNANLAQLALAECHNAQSADNPQHASSAVRIFAYLVERVDAPPDVRVEAGYNLGAILARTDSAKAEAVWWNQVVDPFLVRPVGPQGLGPKGRWWIARTLLDAGTLFERQGRIEEAKRAWLLWVNSGLPGDDVARDKLARFHLPAAKA